MCGAVDAGCRRWGNLRHAGLWWRRKLQTFLSTSPTSDVCRRSRPKTEGSDGNEGCHGGQLLDPRLTFIGGRRRRRWRRRRLGQLVPARTISSEGDAAFS